ncbi:MAG: DNA gyrase inhibitor YacG [Candidatus Binatia bacterium]
MMRTVKCPTCRTSVPWHGNPYRPFCSTRCRTIDLGAWADQSYRIPGERLSAEAASQDAEKQEIESFHKKA